MANTYTKKYIYGLPSPPPPKIRHCFKFNKALLLFYSVFFLTHTDMKLDGNMNVMARSNTWPVVVVRLENNGVHVIEDGPPFDGGGPCTVVTDDLGAVCPVAPLTARKRATLQRHYYPEGGWGWVILATAIAVHLLNHGLQLSAAITLKFAADKHRQPVIHTG